MFHIGEFNVRVAKATAGQYFDGLDMLTKLLAPSGHTSAAGPLIETIGESTTLVWHHDN